MMVKNKKGILGLETVRVVLITLLVLAVTAIAVFLALVFLQNANIFTADAGSGSFINETINLSSAGEEPASVSGRSSVVLSDIVLFNKTNIVGVGNYTVVAGVINATTDSVDYFNSNVNVTASYTFTFDSQAINDTGFIITNITSGTTSFFANVPTFMILLGVVVLLLIIAIVLVVVGRFGGPSTKGTDI